MGKGKRVALCVSDVLRARSPKSEYTYTRSHNDEPIASTENPIVDKLNASGSAVIQRRVTYKKIPVRDSCYPPDLKSKDKINYQAASARGSSVQTDTNSPSGTNQALVTQAQFNQTSHANTSQKEMMETFEEQILLLRQEMKFMRCGGCSCSDKVDEESRPTPTT